MYCSAATMSSFLTGVWMNLYPPIALLRAFAMAADVAVDAVLTDSLGAEWTGRIDALDRKRGECVWDLHDCWDLVVKVVGVDCSTGVVEAGGWVLDDAPRRRLLPIP